MVSSWLLLLAAIGVEVSTTAALPRTDGFRHAGWSVMVLLGYAVSISLLAIVVRHIPVSVAYAVWAGLGTAGIAVIGVVLLGESIDLLKAAAVLMIVVGVVGGVSRPRPARPPRSSRSEACPPGR